MTDAALAPAPAKQSATLVVGASALGTMFEWYDFFLYGALASVIAKHFFSGVDETTGFVFALAAFAVGFLVRPAGALVFGRLGDLVGRKYTFLMTLVIMGWATVLIGVVPGYDAIGLAAPLILVGLRILQGLAIGGEFGGAITYVAEHASAGRRGLHTAFIPATAMAGLLLSLIVIMITRASMPADDFAVWGWRIPFLLSALLLAISLWIRLKLGESPVFQHMKAEAATSKAPLAESFLRWANLKFVLVALFGVVAGQAVVFYTATFYALYFLERTAKVDGLTTTSLLALALALAAPLVVCFGWLSDRVGRKPVVLAGYALAALLFVPLFGALLSAANPALARAKDASPVVVRADLNDCSWQFDPIGRRRFDATACDVIRAYLARAGASYSAQPRTDTGPAEVEIGTLVIAAPNLASIPESERARAIEAFRARLEAALIAAGYVAADPAAVDRPLVVAILVALLALAAMSTGAYSALLVELFPARIRYSALSLPQNVGNGLFGGFLPAIAFTVVAATGDVFAGLWYPVIVAAATFVIGLFLVPETRGRSIL